MGKADMRETLNETVRLNKYLADCGVCSRRKADDMIAENRVLVNGETVAELGIRIDPKRDTVTADGKAVAPPETLEYILLNKPVRVMSTCDDPQGRKTVLDLVPSKARLFPVGRLDYESGGLIILTNDGELAHRVMHPRHSMEKEYVAIINGVLSELDLNKLRDGVYLDGQKTHPAEVTVLASEKGKTEVRFVIHEGRNRQIRNMVRAVDKRVEALIRTRLGSIRLGNLAAGEYRRLTDEEIASLKGRDTDD